MKGKQLSRLWLSTMWMNRRYNSQTSIPPAWINNFSLSAAETIGFCNVSFNSGTSKKLCLSIFISSYTRVSSFFSFARENKARAYLDEIVPKSITYDLLNDISSSSLLMISSWLLSRLIFSFMTFSAMAIDKSVISLRTSRIAFSFSSRI